MGFFRFLLAIAVVIAHSKSIFSTSNEVAWDSIISRENTSIYIWSGHAVFVFFMISGFFMSMVINEKYNKIPNGNSKFILNRALRLYPVNFVILIASFIFYYATNIQSYMTFSLPDQSVPLTIASFFSNIFFLGAEIITFSNPENWVYVNPQIWSISVEIYFYILAPFIVSKSIKLIVSIALISLALRLSLSYFGFPPVPWRYFFFPSILVFFLIGVLAHRLKDFKKYIKGVEVVSLVRYLSLTMVVILLFTKSFWDISGDHDSLTSWFFFTCVALSIPLLFELTKNNKLDNFFGHLSYPIYIGHMFAITLVYYFAKESADRGGLTMVATLFMSVILYQFIDIPIEKLRKKVSSRKLIESSKHSYSQQIN